MIRISQLVIEWLRTNEEIMVLTDGRISTLLQPELGFPAICIGPFSGGPQTTPAANIDTVEDLIVPIYCLAGRRSGEVDDLPDFDTAWELAELLVSHMSSLDLQHYISSFAEIAAARVSTATQSVLTAGNYGRVQVTADIRVWRRQ